MRFQDSLFVRTPPVEFDRAIADICMEMSGEDEYDREFGQKHHLNDNVNIIQYLGESGSTRDTTALIVLHSPIRDIKDFAKIYRNSAFCLCADGAANSLHEAVATFHHEADRQEALRLFLPDAIHGDLDSITDNVRQTYEKLGVPITQDPDQETSDFGKGIAKVIKHLPSVRDILISGSLGGRVDQGIGLLHEIYREQNRQPKLRLWLFSESSVTILLRHGKTVISTPLSSGVITRNVGILPLFGKATISTKGLEWDVTDWSTEMGGRVSTSNHVVADQVEIETNVAVLFTIEMKIT